VKSDKNKCITLQYLATTAILQVLFDAQPQQYSQHTNLCYAKNL